MKPRLKVVDFPPVFEREGKDLFDEVAVRVQISDVDKVIAAARRVLPADQWPGDIEAALSWAVTAALQEVGLIVGVINVRHVKAIERSGEIVDFEPAVRAKNISTDTTVKVRSGPKKGQRNAVERCTCFVPVLVRHSPQTPHTPHSTA